MATDSKEKKRKHTAEEDSTGAVKTKKKRHDPQETDISSKLDQEPRAAKKSKKSTHRETTVPADDARQATRNDVKESTVPYRSKLDAEAEEELQERAPREADGPKRSKKAGLGEDAVPVAGQPSRPKAAKRGQEHLSEEMVVDSDSEPEVGASTGLSRQRPKKPDTTAGENDVVEVKDKSKKKQKILKQKALGHLESETKPKSKTHKQDNDGKAEVKAKSSNKKKDAVATEARTELRKRSNPSEDPDHEDTARKSKKAKVAVMAEGQSSPEDVDDAPEIPTAATATVSHLFCPQSCHPIIATTSGVKVVADATFLPYTNKVRRGKRGDKDLVLHSTTHRALDYTAQEDRPSSGAQPLKYYLAALDPMTGSLEVIEAKKMTLRGVVRSKQASDESLLPQNLNRKADLALTFGTRKAKKALEANALNAISSQKTADGLPVKLTAASKAFMDSIGQVTSGMATQEMLQEAIDGSKPVPPANLRATEIQDVYDPLDFIGPEILNMVPVTDWYEAATKNEPVELVSRFVASRLTRVASSPEAVPRLRVLRYLYFIIVYWKHLRPGKFGTRKLPQREDLKKFMEPAPDVVVDDIKRRFADGSELRKFHCDLLATYCCALGMIVDGFDMDMYDLREDLQLEQQAMTMYFKEIGARVKLVTDKTASGKSIARHRAVLRLPLQFPKQRQASAKNRR